MRHQDGNRAVQSGKLGLVAAIVLSSLMPLITSCVASRQSTLGPVSITSFGVSALNSFSAPQQSIIINPGQSAVLSWVVSGATSLSISDGNSTVQNAIAVSSNSVEVFPTLGTHTYTLTATGPFGSTSTISASNGTTTPATVSVMSVPAPVINSFTVTPQSIFSGQTATLNWTTNGQETSLTVEGTDFATGLLVYNSPTLPAGTTSLQVSPVSTTVYALTANSQSSVGSESPKATVTLQVTVVPPPTVTLQAADAGIIVGASDPLSWTTTSAVKLTLLAVDANHPAGISTDLSSYLPNYSGYKVTPTITTTYSLVAVNQAGVAVVSNAVTVVVSNCPPPVITRFSANPASTGTGDMVGFNAVFTPGGTTGATATATIDNGVGEVDSGSPALNSSTGSPASSPALTASTLFTLTVTNSCNSTATATARVPVGSITTYAGQTIGGYLNGSPATSAKFLGPLGLAYDKTGNLFVTDSENAVIREITPAGVVSTLAGNGTPGYINDPDPTKAEFSTGISGIAVDAAGNVYVADNGNQAVRMIAAGTGAVSTLAGGNGIGFTDGPATVAQFATPRGLALDASGNVYIADSNNNAIRMINSAGVVTTLAGAGPLLSGGQGWADGTGSQAKFNTPNSVTFSPNGNLYVSDTNNHVIRQVTLNGVVTTIAGTPGTPGSTDGIGGAALFDFPSAIASGTSGILYVADNVGDIVRQISPQNDGSYPVATIIGTGPPTSTFTPGGPLPGYTGANTVIGIAADPTSGNLFMTISGENGIYAAPY